MRSLSRVSLTLAVVVMVGLFVMAVKSIIDERSPTVYSSPRAVFDAYIKAQNKGNWRTVFSCLTSESQELEVFEMLIACETTGAYQKALAVRKKYGADDAALNAAYYKKYKEKHGVDIAKLIAERENNAKKAAESRKKQGKKEPASGSTPIATAGPSEELGPPLPPHDEDLVREVVSAQIKDKAGFFEDANKAIVNAHDVELEPRIGQLEGVNIEGDRARGSAKVMIFHLESTHGEATRKVGHTVEMTFHFRRVNGGWLLAVQKEAEPGDDKAPRIDFPVGVQRVFRTEERGQDSPQSGGKNGVE